MTESAGRVDAGGERTLILALGNPILTDDGVGWVVGREVHRRLPKDRADLVEAAVGGLGVLTLVTQYDRVVIVDAIRTPGGQPGSVYRFSVEDLKPTLRLVGAHDVSLGEALQLGKELGYPLPSHLSIYAVEVEDPYTFGESLTPRVQQSVPAAVEKILAEQFGIRGEGADDA